jgi:hypothetical protein
VSTIAFETTEQFAYVFDFDAHGGFDGLPD